FHALAVVAAAMAGAFELVFRGFPFRRAAQMGAASENREQAIRLADDPDAIGHQISLIDAQTEIGWKAGGENRVGLIERPRKEKPQEHQEVDAEIAPNTGPNKPPSP